MMTAPLLFISFVLHAVLASGAVRSDGKPAMETPAEFDPHGTRLLKALRDISGIFEDPRWLNVGFSQIRLCDEDLGYTVGKLVYAIAAYYGELKDQQDQGGYSSPLVLYSPMEDRMEYTGQSMSPNTGPVERNIVKHLFRLPDNLKEITPRSRALQLLKWAADEPVYTDVDNIGITNQEFQYDHGSETLPVIGITSTEFYNRGKFIISHGRSYTSKTCFLGLVDNKVRTKMVDYTTAYD